MKLTIPTSCPLCFGPVRTDGPHLVCVENCNVEAKLIYFFRAFDTKGIGPGLISKMFDGELLPSDKTNLLDILPSVIQLDSERIAQLDGAGDSLAATYRAEVLRIVETGTTTEWLVSLGIPTLAWSTADKLLSELGSIPRIITTLQDSPHIVMQMDGFGETSVSTLVRHLPDMYRLVSTLDELGIKPQEPETIEVQHDEHWSGKNVVITGTLPNGMSRNDAADWLIYRGANVQGGVTGKTDILVAGEKAGSKLAKAQSLGITIIDGNSFSQMVAS